MPGIDATNSSAVSRPPLRFEIVPPVATRRTRGRDAWAVEDAACGGETANPEPTYAVRRVVAAIHARMAEL